METPTVALAELHENFKKTLSKINLGQNQSRSSRSSISSSSMSAHIPPLHPYLKRLTAHNPDGWYMAKNVDYSYYSELPLPTELARTTGLGGAQRQRRQQRRQRRHPPSHNPVRHIRPTPLPTASRPAQQGRLSVLVQTPLRLNLVLIII